MNYNSSFYNNPIVSKDCYNRCNKGGKTYSINREYIHTDIEQGCVRIVYKSIPTDEEGYPLIPNNEKFKEALKYHVLWQLYEPLSYQTDINQNVLEQVQQQYMFYIASSSNSLLMPDVNEMESIKNAIVRLIPSNTQYEQGFKNLNKKQSNNTNEFY